MRKILCSVAVVLLSLSPLAAVAAHGHHHKPKKPDLAVSVIQATISGRQVAVQFVVANHGKKRAQGSSTGVYLSIDAVHDAGDVVLGALPTGRLEPRKSAAAQGTFTVPDPVPAGGYRVIACADSGSVVKEKKETDNCLASPDTATFVPPVLARVSFSNGACCGTVTGQVTPATSGSCDSSSCALTHVPATVVVTAQAASNSYFTGWSPAGCDGTKDYFQGDAGGSVTFPNLTTDKQCIASYYQFMP